MAAVMPSASSRKLVESHASGRHVIVRFQQLTGVTSGPGFADGGTWTDVPGLSNVPVTFRTMMPYERVMAQQLYPGIKSWAFMRWRRGVNVTGTFDSPGTSVQVPPSAKPGPLETPVSC